MLTVNVSIGMFIKEPQPRIFLLADQQGERVDVLLHALYDAGLLTNDSQFILSEAICGLHVWGKDEGAKLFESPVWPQLQALMRGTLCMMPSFISPTFNTLLPKILAKVTNDTLISAGMPVDFSPGWESWTTVDMWKIVFAFADHFDSATAIFVAIQSLLKGGAAPVEVTGEAIKEKLFSPSLQFEGLSGTVRFDERGDRLGTYDIMNLQDKGNTGMFNTTAYGKRQLNIYRHLNIQVTGFRPIWPTGPGFWAHFDNFWQIGTI